MCPLNFWEKLISSECELQEEDLKLFFKCSQKRFLYCYTLTWVGNEMRISLM